MRITDSGMSKSLHDINHIGVDVADVIVDGYGNKYIVFVFTVRFFGNESAKVADALNTHPSCITVTLLARNKLKSGVGLVKYVYDINEAEASGGVLKLSCSVVGSSRYDAAGDARILSEKKWTCRTDVIVNGRAFLDLFETEK